LGFPFWFDRVFFSEINFSENIEPAIRCLPSKSAAIECRSGLCFAASGTSSNRTGKKLSGSKGSAIVLRQNGY
jgi:hypothetical protein